MGYKFFNANACGKFVNDCTIRAISVAEGKTWDETYDELSEMAQDEGILLDDVNFVESVLDRRYDRVYHRCRCVGEFAEEHPCGVYLITMNGHITCCVNGTIYDTFDCRNRLIRDAWCVLDYKE